MYNKVSLISWDDVKIVEIDRTRTKEDIAKMALRMPHNGFKPWYDDYETRYDVEPILTAPYNADSLNREDILDALNAVKMVQHKEIRKRINS